MYFSFLENVQFVLAIIYALISPNLTSERINELFVTQ